MAGLIFRSAAESELRDAYEWYESRRPGLGVEFMECVDACTQILRIHPEIYPTVHKRVRQGLLKRFPYSVLYVLSDDNIVILSVFHSSRDPKIWRRRA